MTVSLYLASVVDAISTISVSGVTVKDKDQIVGSWLSTPFVLYPNPDNFFTNHTVQYDTVLQGASAPMTIAYTLNYRLLVVQVGDIAAFPVSYSILIDKVIQVVDAIIANPAPYLGKIEMRVGNISCGSKADPVGNNYFGADFALNISEMQN